MDRLYDTTKAGAELGGLSAAAVLTLIRDGKLRAKSMVVRGKNRRPRLYVLASEIERYMRDLPAAGSLVPVKKSHPRGAAPYRAELAKATAYY